MVSEFHACACLTMIRNGWQGPTPELTTAIQSDDRLPCSPRQITPAHLPVFAEWQRRLDRELNRVPYGKHTL